MAWYRAGGGGIPSVLKEDMNAVLNKKFSTETVYPPETWANTVNLLGKLPEKTVSGSIAHITDGADAVPIKNLVCEIPANLEGVSSVTTTKDGKNIAIFSKTILDNDRTDHGVTFHATSENTIHISGTATGGTACMVDAYPVGDSRYTFFKKGTYKLSCNMPDNGNYTVAYLNGYYKGTTTTFNTAQNCKLNAPKTFTLTDDAYLKIQIMVYNGYSIDDDIWVQIEEGSTATQYAEYIEPEVIVSQLGQTVYGGHFDLISGLLSVEYVSFALENIQWISRPVGGVDCWRAEDWTTENLKLPTNSSIFDGVCDTYTPIRFNGVSANVNTIALRDNGWLHINNGSTSISPTGHVTIALATPVAYQLTPQEIQTLYGENTIWNDAGDTSVTYRRDIELALSGSTPLMMMSRPPVIEDEPQVEGVDE